MANRLIVTARLTATVPAGACVVSMSEDVITWVVDTFASNAAYLAWYETLPIRAQVALAYVSGVIEKVDLGWPLGAIETAYAATTAQRDITALYDQLTMSGG